MNRIQEKLNLLGWSIDKLLKHLDTAYQKKLRDRERHREYFEKNKKKLYDYHKKYRENHPEYEEKKRLRANKQNGK